MALKVKLIGTVLNGVAKLEFENLNDQMESQEAPVFEVSFLMHCKSLLHKNEEIYFTDDILEGNSLYIKAPLHSDSYSLQLQFDVSFSTSKYTMSSTKVTITLEIPPMRLDKEFRMNDLINYDTNSDEYGTAMVIEQLDDDMFTIQDVTDNHDIHTVHLSKLSLPAFDNTSVIDIANKKEAVIDLMCLNGTEDIYDELMNFVKVVFPPRSMWDDPFRGLDEMRFAVRNILSFLCGNEYYYRIKCPFDNVELIMNETWYDSIICDGDKCQERRLGFMDWSWCYICDICRVEMSWYDLYCQGNVDDDCHIFCVTCIHSMVMSYRQYNGLVYDALEDCLNDHCLVEIVQFCAGNIAVFELVDDEEMRGDLDEVEFEAKPVGSKRQMINDCETGSKKRRLE